MVLEHAKNTLKIESEAIKALIPRLGKGFTNAVDAIYKCKGRVIVTGIGKSGLVARKIAATLASTGTPAFFIHPAECIHGDIGMIMKGDIVVALSYSGESEEIGKILPVIKRMGLKLISLTAKKKSSLATYSDFVIDVTVKKEACPYNLAPTASTTAMLAMGDALAIALLYKRGFKKENFAKLHPGGNLGKKLLLKVSDIMRKGSENPVIDQDKTVKEALLVMTSCKLGAVSVVDKAGKLKGFFTDGDLRRHWQKGDVSLSKKISSVMTKNPVTINPDMLATEAVKLIQERNFDNIPVIDAKLRPVGIVDERDLLKEGLG
ncbi:MAG: KpsF/GutQ family sugar-phosphate isomerase [bacterium]